MSFTISHAGVCRYYAWDSPEEIVFKNGNNCFVEDTNQNRYIDFILGHGPVIIGHNNELFNKKLIDYLGNGIHFPGYSEWHRKYIDLLFGDLQADYRVSFFKTASEAITAALKLTAKYNHKLGYIRCGYIGWYDSLIGKTLSWHEPLNSPLRDVIRFDKDIRGISDNEAVFNWVDLDINSLKNMIKENQGIIGAFVIDAYQLAFTDPDTIKKALNVCRENSVVTVFDETKTGGRVSKNGIAIDNGLDVDMIVLGKSLANGAPLSLLVGNRHIMDLADEARICGTFSKELLGIYSAMATYDIMAERNGYELIRENGNKIIDIINNVITDLNIDNIISGLSLFGGSMIDLNFKGHMLSQKGKRDMLIRCLLKNNIVMTQGHPSFICLDHQLIDFNYLENKFKEAFILWKSLSE
jgi:glutamate-1-semialdehyde 2,1-aminomutase